MDYVNPPLVYAMDHPPLPKPPTHPPTLPPRPLPAQAPVLPRIALTRKRNGEGGGSGAMVGHSEAGT